MKSLVILLLLCLCATAHAAKIYKWTDEAGNVHYSERPPAGKAQELQVPKSKPSTTSTPGERLQETNRLLQAIDKERKEKADKAAAAAKEKARREEQCRLAKRRAALYEMGGRIFDIDEKGERRYLSDAEIQQKLTAARKDVEKWCQ